MANPDHWKQGGLPASPGEEAVRSELARLVADERLANSPTLIRFLEYTVLEALAGRGDQLKESWLGREVFDRGPDFDPRIDPIVRVQAGKLRARLAEYYESRGLADPLRIEYSKGSYAPHFRPFQPDAEPAKPVAAPAGSAVSVAPLTPTADAQVALRRRLKRLGVIAAALAVAAAGAWLWFHRRATPEPKIALVQLTFEAGSAMNPAISRDGKLLAYSSDRGRGDLNIWIRPIDGGTPVQVTHDEAADHSPDFSPDGTLIAFHSYRQGGGVYVVSVFGGEERFIAKEAWAPRFSPDGSWIAYVGSDRSIFVAPLAGGQPRQVSGGTIDAFGGAIWTPKGSHLIFLGAPRSADTTKREYDWYSVPLIGGTPAPASLREQLRSQGLPPPTSTSRPGDWLGSAIVFSLQSAKAANIWKVPFSTNGLRVAGPAQQLTAGTAAETFPRCSVAGRMVLTSESQMTHVFSLQLDPRTGEAVGSPEQLTSDSSLMHDGSYPRISTDGRTLSYVSNRSGTQELVLKGLVRGGETSLGALPRQESLPLIWGDESLLVYGSGDVQTIYSVERDRPFAERICDRCGRVLDWSSDRHTILLEDVPRRTLQLWDRDSGRRVELMTYPVGTLQNATLSADGKWVAISFSSPRGGVLFPLSGGALSGAQAIPAGMGADLQSLHWAPDGNCLYSYSRLDDYRCLWGQRLDPASKHPVGKPFSVQHFHSNRLAPWGTWISVGTGRMVFTLTEPRSNIWLATMEGPLPAAGRSILP